MALIAVTGANGFVGRQLVERLRGQHEIRCIVRTLDRQVPEWTTQFETVAIGSIGPTTDWSLALEGADAVVHLASIAHRAAHKPVDLIGVNVDGVKQLAEEAIRMRVRRLLFISTIGVHGNTTKDMPFDELSPLNPQDNYAQTKLAAERELSAVSKKHGLETVIIRPPLVYGRHAPGNFGRLVRMLQRGMPMPFGAIENKRSLVSVTNLCDFIGHAILDPRATNQVFVISDGEDISTPELIRRLAQAMQIRPRLIKVPSWMLRIMFNVSGKSNDLTRLCGSLQVNSNRARVLLDWQPPLAMEDCLNEAVAIKPT